MESSQLELENLDYRLNATNEDFTISISDFKDIINDTDKLKRQSTKLEEEIEGKVKMKFDLEINILVFVSVLTLIGLISKQMFKKLLFNYEY